MLGLNKIRLAQDARMAPIIRRSSIRTQGAFQMEELFHWLRRCSISLAWRVTRKLTPPSFVL